LVLKSEKPKRVIGLQVHHDGFKPAKGEFPCGPLVHISTNGICISTRIWWASKLHENSPYFSRVVQSGSLHEKRG